MFNIGSCPGYMVVYSQRVVVHVLVEIQNDLYHRSHWTVGKLEISDPVHFQKVSNLCLFLFRIFQHLFGHRHWVGSHGEYDNGWKNDATCNKLNIRNAKNCNQSPDQSSVLSHNFCMPDTGHEGLGELGSSQFKLGSK